MHSLAPRGFTLLLAYRSTAPDSQKGPADALALFRSAKDDVGERQTSCKRTTLGVVQLVSTFLMVSYTTLVALNSQGRLTVRTKTRVNITIG